MIFPISKTKESLQIIINQILVTKIGNDYISWAYVCNNLFFFILTPISKQITKLILTYAQVVICVFAKLKRVRFFSFFFNDLLLWVCKEVFSKLAH